MPAQQTRSVIEEELGGVLLEEVFEWIDLEQPLGSASIAQVLYLCAHFEASHPICIHAQQSAASFHACYLCSSTLMSNSSRAWCIL